MWEHDIIAGDLSANPGKWILVFPLNMSAWHTGHTQKSRNYCYSCCYYYMLLLVLSLEKKTKARTKNKTKQARIRGLATPTTNHNQGTAGRDFVHHMNREVHKEAKRVLSHEEASVHPVDSA